MGDRCGIRLAVWLALVGVLGSALGADAESSGILYGQDHVYELTAPDGWVLDNRAGVEQGLHAVFYPQGGSWSESRAVMYTSTDRLAPGQSLDDFIAGELRKFSASVGGGLRVKVGKPIDTAARARAEVRLLSGDSWGNFESIAYLDAAPVVAMVVLTSRNASEYAKSEPAFEQLVASYRFLGRSLAQISSLPHLIQIAEANTRTEAGARYDAEVGKRFAEQHAGSLRLCMPSGVSAPPSVDILLLVAKTGAAQRVVVAPESEVGRCLQRMLAGSELPPPPSDGFWVRIQLSITE